MAWKNLFKLLKTFLKKDVSKCVQSIERHTTLFDKEVEFVSVKFKCVSIFLPVFSGIKVYKKSYCIELNKREVIRDIFHFLISILRHKPKHVLTAFSFCELYVINSYVAFVIRSSGSCELYLKEITYLSLLEQNVIVGNALTDIYLHQVSNK